MNKLIILLFIPLCGSQPSNVYEHPEENSTDIFEYVLLDSHKHPCTRTCTKYSAPMVCKYKFTLELYHTMSKACYECPHNAQDCSRPHCIPGDGTKRPALVINRQMPGPSVEVCLGDEIVVDLHNTLMDQSTTIHWHGHHQIGTPYMDGVPHITQCPIPPESTFRYSFKAMHPGTHFWHSHSGMQRTDGVFGAFVVRVPEEEDPHGSLYDYDLSEHIMLIMDWGPEMGIAKFSAHHHSNGDNKPETILVNGLGRLKEFNNNTNQTFYSPTARFVVERGYRYRFRVINAGFLNCPIEISVDNHTIAAISSDGHDFIAVNAESLVTYAGERFDFVLNADQPTDLYWIRFRGHLDCGEKFNSAHQVAVLEYKGASTIDYPQKNSSYRESHKEGLQINSVNRGTGENSSVNVVELKSLAGWDESLKETPDYKFFVSYDFYNINNPHFHWPNLYGFDNVTDIKQRLYTPQLNHISLKMQPSPLLPGRDHIDPREFCNSTTVKNCTTEFCECTHVLQVPLNSVVELILIDIGVTFDANHPFHLHGYSFRVVSMHKLGNSTSEEIVRNMDKAGLIKRNLINPPKKDTVTVPDGGFTILRFHATNPGYWLLHCHLEFHIAIGMGLVVKVGDNSEMPPVPVDFPKCGNYLPERSPVVEENRDNGLSDQIKKFILEHTHSKSDSIKPTWNFILQSLSLFILSSSIFIQIIYRR